MFQTYRHVNQGLFIIEYLSYFILNIFFFFPTLAREKLKQTQRKPKEINILAESNEIEKKEKFKNLKLFCEREKINKPFTKEGKCTSK